MNLALLSLFALSLRLPRQTSATNHGRFLPVDNHNSSGPPLESGLCSGPVKKYGYKCKEYNVTTIDGYKLKVHRILEGRSGGVAGKRPPVLLQHGVLLDGVMWVLTRPEESLAMILADKGFDVWISNVRGTRYSRSHVKYDPANPKFWDWTWDDLVTYDLPSITDLIFKQTRRKIHYVGHSMGSLMALASLSERKMENVKSVVLLSPIAHLSHLTSGITFFAAHAFLGEIGVALGLAEFNAKGEAEIFFKSLRAYAGMDLSVLTITAFSAIRNGNLSKFDFGNPRDNEAHYGKPKPPIYNLSKIPHDVPLYVIYGGKDAMSDPKDVHKLLDDIKSHNEKKLEVLYIPKYAHLDFVLAVNAKDVIYDKIAQFLRTHNGGD